MDVHPLLLKGSGHFQLKGGLLTTHFIMKCEELLVIHRLNQQDMLAIRKEWLGS